MPGDIQQEPVAKASLERRHEVQNPPAGWVVLAAASVPLMTVACILVVRAILANWTVTHPLDASIRLRGTIIAPGIEPLTRFPRPNLELNPHVDLTALRAHEDAELDSYGWVDRKAGLVRIPIDRAMDMVAQRGLPFRASNAPAAVGPSELDLSRARSPQP